MIAVRTPDGRTINVQTTDPQAAAKAVRVMLAREGIQQAGGLSDKGGARGAAGQALAGTASGLTYGLSDVADAGMKALGTGANNLVDRAMGKTPSYGMGDAYEADRQMQKERSAAHPIADAAGGLFGTIFSPASLGAGKVVAEGAKVTNAPKVVQGLLNSTGLLPQTVRGGAAGGLLGGLSGAASADPGHELEGAGAGAVAGGVTGAVAPAVLAAGGKVVQGVAGAGKTIARAANKATGGQLLDAQSTAAQRLTEALKADGATPDQIRATMNQWLRTGVSPTLMDVASSLPNGGQSTLGLLRGSAMKAGPARGAAMAHNEQTESSLAGRAIKLARDLTPDKRPAQAITEDLTQSRNALAQEQYRAPYAEPVDTAPVVDALSGKTGQDAVRGATRLADANRSGDELSELQGITRAANPPPVQPTPPATIGGDQINLGPRAEAQVRAVSGVDQNAPIPPTVRLGTLDHLKQGLNQMGQDAVAKGDNRLAAGLFQRAAELDDHLAEVSPGYGLARDNFHQGSNRIAGVELGRTGMTASPDDFAANMANLKGRVNGQGPSPAQKDAGVGYRQEMTDALAHQPAGAVGTLKRLGTAEDQTANLAETFGQDAAGNFQGGINNLRRQVANSRFIDPSTGSQTAGRASDAMDLKDVSPPKLPGVMEFVTGIVNKIRQGATLTDGEREAIINLGLAKPEHFQWVDHSNPVIDRITSSGGYLAPAASELAGRRAAQ